MALRLRITSEHKNRLVDGQVCEFSSSGGTIGRGPHNDWVLPDEKRFISSRHAVIDCRDGAYYITDKSRNGVFINKSESPLGPGRAQRLNQGDRLYMGEYVIEVESATVDEADNSPEARPRDDIRDADTGRYATRAHSSAEPDLDSTNNERMPAGTMEIPVSAERLSGNTKTHDTAAEAAVDAFCNALGLRRDEIPGMELPAIAAIAGSVMREMLNGLAQLLRQQSEIRALLNLPAVGGKAVYESFATSADAGQALLELLTHREDSGRPGAEVVNSAFGDISVQQQAFVKAIVHAMREFTEQLDPDELRLRFDENLGKPRLLARNNKLKYWELFEETYPTITQHEAGTPLPAILINELINSYTRELEALRRSGKRTGRAS